MRVLVVDDDSFTLHLTRDIIEADGHQCFAVANAADAFTTLHTADPHVIVSDLNLGPGPNGADILWHAEEHMPWVGKVVLTVHSSAETALPPPATLPPDTVYVVKHQVSSADDLRQALGTCLNGPRRTPDPGNSQQPEADTPHVTAVQAETLRLLAAGFTNERIAQQRGVSLRAVESTVKRLFVQLGISDLPGTSPRVLAATMWMSGKIHVREP